MDHVKSMNTWYELRLRLKKNETIDKSSRKLIEKEKEHWKHVLKRIVAGIKFLAKQNMAFRGSNERLYERSNGNFLSLIESYASFDPYIQEHVRRITDEVEESFLGFLRVNDTTGQGLFDVLKNELKNLGHMRGQANSCEKAKDFFGVIQRIHTVFASSTKRWDILKDNVKGSTPKSLSSTRWESHVNSVKAIKSQMSDFREALLEVVDNEPDPKATSDAKTLAENELGDFEFLVAIIIWFEILTAINVVSKFLQSKDILIDVAMQKIKGLTSYFEKYRESGFQSALNSAKEIAIESNIDPVFRQKRIIRRKKQFDENLDTPSVELFGEELFRVNYFLCLVDQAVVSLNRRFEQYQEYEKKFSFLFSSHMLKSLDDARLNSACSHLEEVLKHNEQSDIDGNELCVELKLLRELLPGEKMGPMEILTFLKDLDYFPNTIIAYRILLTIPVTVASAERSFSKLKLLKSYLRSVMGQERLNGLAMISIEYELLETIPYEDLIDEFASKTVRRISLFK